MWCTSGTIDQEGSKGGCNQKVHNQEDFNGVYVHQQLHNQEGFNVGVRTSTTTQSRNCYQILHIISTIISESISITKNNQLKPCSF